MAKALQKESRIVFTCEDSQGDPNFPYFGLQNPDLTQIRPNYDAMIKGGHLKVTELGVHQSKFVNLCCDSGNCVRHAASLYSSACADWSQFCISMRTISQWIS